MSIKAAIYHLTHYKYDRPVILQPQIIRLQPAPHSKTKVISHSLRVLPAQHFVNVQQDPYGNFLTRFVFPEPVSELKIEVDLVADMTIYNPFDFFVEESAETWPFSYPDDLIDDLAIYRRPEPLGPALARFLEGIDKTPRNTVNFVIELNAGIQRSVNYIVRLEPGVWSPEETLTQAKGSCRDSSWLLVNALRHLGFATRFVSGYLIQLKPDLVALDGPAGTDRDFTDLHAWCEVYLPGAGWVGLDPTSGLLTGESHVPLAATPHYRKWYPGETLPRWTFSLYWRADGKPVWNDESLIAKEGESYDVAPEEGEALSRAIAAHLGLTGDTIAPAYEDPGEWLLKESKLPDNVDPANSKLADPEERARIASVFSRGLTNPTGYVLPIQRWNAQADAQRWITEAWKTRRGKLFLAPGDSAAGYRLPLSSLRHLDATAYPHVVPQDPGIPRGPLPEFTPPPQGMAADPRAQQAAAFTAATEVQNRNEQVLDEIDSVVRTALTVEVRDGRFCVFLPPVAALEDYLELIAATEAAARQLGKPVHVEGYPPPHDPRLNVIRVAPDPGVIEVNIHPASNWQDCVATTTAIYDEARQSRLGADKFMIDGKHTGTGGGNHVVVGGATPQDSPFLRRPDLLKSLVLHWQRHPSMSYLFSGLFIGPTSQAPRLDEARHDSLYELEIALSQVPAPGQGMAPSPWLTDRLFRNLLVDVTGNTHRAEICVDKLYSPDGPTGRLGLVEFRGFEMPPNARMSLAQQLLVRALIARYWQTPLAGDFTRWGTALHDRFMLSSFVWQDFLGLLNDLGRHGFLFDPAWFAAQLEFRFPFCGEVEADGVKLELRQALEPWHVMGEQGAIGGTVRYVDSSLERLEVKLDAANPGRYAVTCNQRPVPLKPSGTTGGSVAGVRFKAWQPASGLHPTMPVHAPLIFDIYDTWSGRAIGGCIYHVAHPGGRNYETFPVNGNEAEARRLARFIPHNYSPGPYPLRMEKPADEFALTLDLRRPPRFT